MKSIRLWAGVLALALALGLCGCSNPEAEDSALYATATNNTEILSGVDEPVQATPLENFAVSYLPEAGFNPFTCASTTNRTLFTFLYDSLFTITSDFQAEPVLCDTFSVSEDQQTYRFTLVPGVTFSDGSALSADDVVASLQAGRNSKYYAGRLSHVSGVRALDGTTVEVTLDTPFENLPLVLDVPVVKAGTTDQDAPIGTGSYAVSGSTLRRCTKDWHSRTPVIDVASISLLAADSPNQIRDDFEFGNTGLVCTDPNTAGSVGYHCNYDVWDCSTTIMQYIGFNCTSGLFVNNALRTGMTYAIDRATLISQELDGYAEAASLPCSPCSPFYDATLAEQYAYSPTAFQTALQNSGALYTEDAPGTFLVCSSDPAKVSTAQAIAKMLEEQGFYVNVKAVDFDTYRSTLAAGNYDMYYGEVKLSANFDLSCFYTLDGSLNFGGIADSDIAQLCLDALKNSGSYQNLFTAVMDDGAICPVLFKNYAVYMSRDAVDYIAPAIDNALHVPSGRTLADANITYESPADSTDETSSDDTPEP